MLKQVKAHTASFPGKQKDHMRVHAGGPLVLINGEYLGCMREFEKFVKNKYQYVDNTIDSFFTNRARK